MLRKPAVVALVAWTLLIWTTRLANIWRDSDLGTPGKVARGAIVLGITAVTLWVVVVAWKGSMAAGRRAVQILAGGTIFLWLFSLFDITFGDWSAGFKVVHTILAVVSVGLAYLALRACEESHDPSAVSGPSAG